MSNYKISIELDNDPQSPREWDNVGTILYTSARYTLGDKQVTREEIDEITERDDVVWLPVYAYIHSGISLSVGSFSCPWDSGQCGIIYAEKSKIAKELCSDPNPSDKEIEEKGIACLKSEVETYSQYLSGDVYGYIIQRDGDEIDSCWGFFGQEDAEGQAKEALAGIKSHDEEEERNSKKLYKTTLVIWSEENPVTDAEGVYFNKIALQAVGDGKVYCSECITKLIDVPKRDDDCDNNVFFDKKE